MEKFEKGCWYKKVFKDPRIDFYDVFKFDSMYINPNPNITDVSNIIRHTCFYRLFFDGRIKYYKNGNCTANDEYNTITKINTNCVGTIISDHKAITEEIKINEVTLSTELIPNNWTKLTSNYIYKKSLDVKEEIEYLQSMIKYFNDKIELLKKNQWKII